VFALLNAFGTTNYSGRSCIPLLWLYWLCTHRLLLCTN